MLNDDWENTSGETFDTKADADAYLADLIGDCEYSVRMGYMSDFSPADWRVQECEQNG